jgi:predicted AAA+ superfamily ATPase
MVGQEILASSDPRLKKELFTWMREKPGADAEVDYIDTLDGKLIPIEVKAGRGDHLKSLRLYQDEKRTSRGVVFSTDMYRKERDFLRMPLYSVGRVFN